MGIFSKLEEFLNNKLELSDESKEIVNSIVEGKLPLIITANTSAEINALIEIIKELI